MTNKLSSYLILASAAFAFSSCLKSTDEDVILQDDTAVTTFSIPTLSKNVHTTAKDGVTDSVYKANFNAKSYSFHIDQVQKQIFNPDSLPYGTNTTNVKCDITGKNSSHIYWALKNKAGEDSLVLHSSKDSINLAKPARLRIYNMSNTAYREYIVKINVHQQTGNEITWQHKAYANLSDLADRKMVFNNNVLYVFGVKNGQTVVLRQMNGVFQQLPTTFDADAYRNATVMDGNLYLLNGDKVMQTAIGDSWKQTGTAPNNARLIGASTKKLYVMTATGIMSSDDMGASWKTDAMDAGADNLPTGDINFVCVPSAINTHVNNLTIVGTRNNEVKIWSKVEENETCAQDQAWTFFPKDDYNKHPLPYMSNLQVIAYDKGLLALGGDFKTFYFSKDMGLTWFADNTYMLDKAFGNAIAPFSMVNDSRNVIHISKTRDANIWTARLARLAWATNQ